MKIAAATVTGAQQPLTGILLIVVATLLFASHDALAKYLSGLYPIIIGRLGALSDAHATDSRRVHSA